MACCRRARSPGRSGDQWQRCRKAGLDPRLSNGFDIVTRGRAREIGGASRELVGAAHDDMESLAAAVARAKLIVMLADRHGIVVDTFDDKTRFSPRLGLAARIGVDLSERAVGTNAVRTALVEEGVIAIVADEHYFEANAGLTCVVGEATVAIEPGEGAFDDPAPRQDFEAGRCRPCG